MEVKHTPLNPQPTDDELLQRYYAYLKEVNNYRKQVSWLSHGGNKEIAVAEYIGHCPGSAPHGNILKTNQNMLEPLMM